jgi:hypothetical protein
MNNKCPVCDSDLKHIQSSYEGKDATFFSCPLCGNFILSGSLISTLPHIKEANKNAGAKLSHSLRRMHEEGDRPFLYTTTVDKILERPFPNPKEQADLLIRWLGENVEGPGETVRIEPTTHKSIVGAKSDDGFALVVKHLFDIGLIIGNYIEGMGSGGKAEATLSFDGWEYFENLKRGSSTYRKAFIAMKFGDPLLDKILKDHFKPCVKQTGFELYRLDDVPKAGLIDDRLRVEIQSSDFLIADLTHDNPGSYWEAGYAEGLGKPVIYTCEKDKFEKEKTHFDTNHHLTIIWNSEDPKTAEENLKATIRATFPGLAKMEDN